MQDVHSFGPVIPDFYNYIPFHHLALQANEPSQTISWHSFKSASAIWSFCFPYAYDKIDFTISSLAPVSKGKRKYSKCDKAK
jgi:hypothetical protein